MDDDMPDLEDFSEELKNIRDKTGKNDNKEEQTNISVKVIESNNTQIPINSTNTITNPISNTNTNSMPTNTTTTTSKSNTGGGGLFKKGFFHRQAEIEKNQPNESKTTSNTNKQEVVDLTHIKKTTDPKKDLILKDVQKEMTLGNSVMDKKDEWLNKDLLNKIAKNPKLLQYMLDPRFQEVI